MKIFLFSLLLSWNGLASPEWNVLASPDVKWVKVAEGKELYVEYYAPATGRPTLVLLHGLTYTTRQWKPLITELRKFGFGIVNYDMEGMGQTLLRYAPVRNIIPNTTHVQDLKVLLKSLNVTPPYNLLGLSYGAGVGFNFSIRFPELTGHVILMAPYIKPLKKIDDYIRTQVTNTRRLNPNNPYSDDEIYEFFFRHFVYSTYPRQEPIVLENPYKLEAVFRLSQGVAAFIPEEHTDELQTPMTLMIPEKDQYFPAKDYEDFWAQFPEKVKANLIYIKNSEHKIPESQPAQTAQYINEILKTLKAK